MSIICQIYRSARESGMYLYVKKDEQLSRVPQALLQQFGRAEPAMVLLLNAQKKLANADIHTVLASLEERGFYLQMPPSLHPDDELAAVREHNTTLN